MRQILYNLKKNSVSAFRAAIEIHNKPNIEYRYETVTILLLNSWELILKSYVKKYTRKSIFEKDNKTIGLDKALSLTLDNLNAIGKGKQYKALFENIKMLTEYRDSNIHFYNEKGLDAIMFSLITRSVIGYNDFYKEFFGEDVLENNNLVILPIGFKLPFDPIKYLSPNNDYYKSNHDIKEFIDSIIIKTKELKESDIEDSIIVGMNIFLSSAKKIDNSDIIAAIDNENSDTDVSFAKKVEYTNEEGAAKVYISDDALVANYPLSYREVWDKCKEKKSEIKRDNNYNQIMKDIKENKKYCHKRLIRPGKDDTNYVAMYSDETPDYVIENYYKQQNNK